MVPKKYLHFLNLIFQLILIVGIVYFINFLNDNVKKDEENLKKYLPTVNKDDREINLNAKSYVIYDINKNEVIDGKNHKNQYGLASVSKVVTLYTIFQVLNERNVHISAIDTNYVKTLERILVTSSNEDVEALTKKFETYFGLDFYTEYKRVLAQLNIFDIVLLNPTGLDTEKSKVTNLGSAESIAKLMGIIFTDKKFDELRNIFELTRYENVNGASSTLVNTNTSAENFFGMRGGKTGYTDAVGGNLAVVVSPTPDSSYSIVVLESIDKKTREVDIKRITENLNLIIKNYFDRKNVIIKGN